MSDRWAAAYAGKTAVVTGAGGFIGSHLCEALARSGARVRALVRYGSTGSHGHLRELAPDLRAAVDVTLGDVTDPLCVRGLVRSADVVFHLAALIGIPYSYVAPHAYVATNVQGTLHVLEAAREHGARVVVTSTSETYGTARYTPIDEAHPLTAQSPYAATKIAADKLAESYHLAFGLPVATIRPFNTYGPRQSARAIIPALMAQLAAGRTEVRMGSPEPLRDLNFVTDTVEGFLAVGSSDAAIGQVVNVGSGKAISMGDLARRIVAITGKSARIVHDASRVRPDASEVRVLLASAERARELCGWAPRVSLDEGLAATWAHVEQRVAAYRPDDYAV